MVPDRWRPKSAGVRAWSRAQLLGGGALLAFASTVSLVPVVTGADGDLDRAAPMFPGVPAWWVSARLAALGSGALLLCAWIARLPSVPTPWRIAPPRHDSVRRWQLQRGFEWAGLACACFALGLALVIGSLSLRWQLAYFVSLVLPSLLVFSGSRFAPRRGRSFASRRSAAFLVALIVVAWGAARGIGSLNDLRSADVVDYWDNLELIHYALREDSNLFTSTSVPGVTIRYLIFQGMAFFALKWASPSFVYLQASQVLWSMVAALAVARVVADTIGGRAAPFAVAVFLWSPFMLAMPLSATPFVLGVLFAAILLACWVAVARRGSAAALVTLAAGAGFSLTLPPIAPISGVTLALALWSAASRRDISWTVLFTSGVVMIAAVVPSVPAFIEALGLMQQTYMANQRPWAALEAGLFGQMALAEILALNENRMSSLDVPWYRIALGAIVAPFAIPRTALRSWGDMLFDPLGTALAAVGLGLCLRWAGRDRLALGCCALLLLAIVPGALGSSYDRTSATRMIYLPVPMAFLAAIGLEGLLSVGVRSRVRRWIRLSAVLAVVAGGTYLFDFVNPRILAQSAMGLALRAIDGNQPRRGALWLRSPYEHDDKATNALILSEAGRSPLPRLSFEGPGSLSKPDATRSSFASVVFWSPGLEADAGVTRAICEHWSEATLYVIHDPVGQSRVHAAVLDDSNWIPELPSHRWERRKCT